MMTSGTTKLEPDQFEVDSASATCQLDSSAAKSEIKRMAKNWDEEDKRVKMKEKNLKRVMGSIAGTSNNNETSRTRTPGDVTKTAKERHKQKKSGGVVAATRASKERQPFPVEKFGGLRKPQPAAVVGEGVHTRSFKERKPFPVEKFRAQPAGRTDESSIAMEEGPNQPDGSLQRTQEDDDDLAPDELESSPQQQVPERDPSMLEAVLVTEEESKEIQLAEIVPQEEKAGYYCTPTRGALLCVGLAILVSAGAIVAAIMASAGDSNNSVPVPAPVVEASQVPTAPSTSVITNPNTTFFQTTIQTPFTNKLLDISIQIIVSDASSPQAMANTWMLNDPNLDIYPTKRSLARYALATLFFSTNGSNWKNRSGWLSYEIHECDWYMSHPTTTCDEEGDHIILNLTSNQLNGTANTRELLLYLWKVHTVDVSNNTLGGDAPPLLNERESITYLDYSQNHLRGRISAAFGWENPSLQVFRIQHNQLSGGIPPSLYSIFPNAQEINLGFNDFTGNIPNRILGNNTKLRILDFGDNQFYGTIPKSLEHLLALEVLDVSGNEGVTGTI